MTSPSDYIQLEVLKNSLESIADSMALTVVRTSRSSVVKTGMDFSTAVLSPRGELVGQGLCSPIHLGGMMPALKSCLERYESRIYPGDVLINNDPYEGGSHLPDIFLFKPVFSNDDLVGYLCAMTHQTDIGGRVAGGNACDSTEIYQEGLRIPPLKLYEKGYPNDALFRLLEKAVRVPDKVLGDVQGQLAALDFGEREFKKLVRKSGVEQIKQSMDELLVYTEELTRKGISRFPDGSWSFSDYLDGDGISDEQIRISVNLTKQGDQIHVDFSGTSEQCKGAIQPVFATSKAMVYAVLRSVLGSMGYDVPNTAGYFRPVTVTAPEGTFVNPLPPAPVAARSLGCLRVAQTVFGAFAQMLPSEVFACFGGCELGISMSGYNKSKVQWVPWIQLEFHNQQAIGGYPWRDACDAQVPGFSTVANIPAEQLEIDQPLQVLDYGFVTDSEGAGQYRGGLVMVREFRYLEDDIQVQVRADRKSTQPYGLFGGHSPAPTVITLNSKSSYEQDMPTKFLINVKKGDRLRFQWPGAGGWGDPANRDHQAVLDDVRNNKISPERAVKVYGLIREQIENH